MIKILKVFNLRILEKNIFSSDYYIYYYYYIFLEIY